MSPEAERLRIVLDAHLMGGRLAAVLGGAGRCHVLDAKYEHEVSAVVLYELDGRLVRGDLLPRGTRHSPDRGGHGAGHVVEPGLRLRLFPDDPDLPVLPRLIDPTHLGPALGRLQPGGPRRQDRCRIRLLRYRPGKRATVLVRVAPSSPALVAKAYHAPAKAAAVADEALALSGHTSSGQTLRLAAPLGLLDEWGVVVQEAVTGAPLDALLTWRESPDRRAVEGVRRAAQALAELHRLPAVTRRSRPVERELHRFGDRARRTAALDPDFSARAAHVAGRLLERHRLLPPPRPGLVHGDCKPSQFLLAGDHAYLLDLDHCGISDQAVDVGTFLASLRQLAVRRDLSRRARSCRTASAPLEQLFVDDYLAARAADPDRGAEVRIRWHQAAALERKALRAFARSPRSILAPALLEEAERCLDVG